MKNRPFTTWSLYFLFGLIILFITNPLFSSRSPAVDPIIGLSIDEENPITPSEVRGFNFRSHHLKVLQPAQSQTLVKNIIQIFSLLFLLSLPFALWNRILTTSKKENQKPSLRVIKGEKGKRDHENSSSDDDDDDDGKNQAA